MHCKEHVPQDLAIFYMSLDVAYFNVDYDYYERANMYFIKKMLTFPINITIITSLFDNDDGYIIQ